MPWRNLIAFLALLCVPVSVTACGDATATVANGHILRMVAVKDPIFPPSVPQGYTLYSLTYESEGKPVQGYLGVPPGKGPFQLVVFLHGGSPIKVSSPAKTGGLSASVAADEILPAPLMFFPNYRGYRPSPGDVQDGYHDYLDTVNGLTALRHISGLRVAPHDIFLAGTSLGGFVALRLVAEDPDVRAVLLTSPWPGMDTVLAWLKTQFSQSPQARSAYNQLRSYGGPKPGAWLRRNSITLARIHVPILIIGGTEDQIIPPSLLRYLDRQLSAGDPHVTLTFLPGGHAPAGTGWLEDFDTFMNREGLSMMVPEP